jgi:DNA-binding MurR/RpiR family transcriptional regulator
MIIEIKDDEIEKVVRDSIQRHFNGYSFRHQFADQLMQSNQKLIEEEQKKLLDKENFKEEILEKYYEAVLRKLDTLQIREFDRYVASLKKAIETYERKQQAPSRRDD